jgi:hypothetical protein
LARVPLGADATLARRRGDRAKQIIVQIESHPLTLRVAEGNAINSGDASWGRLIGSDGKALLDFKMTLRGGGGVLEWNTLELRKGGPVTVFSNLNFYRGRDEKEEDEEAKR